MLIPIQKDDYVLLVDLHSKGLTDPDIGYENASLSLREVSNKIQMYLNDKREVIQVDLDLLEHLLWTANHLSEQGKWDNLDAMLSKLTPKGFIYDKLFCLFAEI